MVLGSPSTGRVKHPPGSHPTLGPSPVFTSSQKYLASSWPPFYILPLPLELALGDRGRVGGGAGFRGLGASQQTPEAEMGEPRGALRAAGRQGIRDPAVGEKEWARKVGRGKGEAGNGGGGEGGLPTLLA